VVQRSLRLFIAMLAVAALGGCCLFAPSPVVPERNPHVIVVGLGAVRPADITPSGTPNLNLFKHDGAYTLDLKARNTKSRAATFCEVLTGVPEHLHVSKSDLATDSLMGRARAAGRRVVSVIRSGELDVFDPAAVTFGGEVTSPLAVGTAAARRFTRLRPELMFVELGLATDSARDCDAGLGRILTAVRRAGVAERTTVLVVSTGTGPMVWMVRGPGTRHGRKMTGSVWAADTHPTVAKLLAIEIGTTQGKVVGEAFRMYSDQPAAADERVVARGSIHGRLFKSGVKPMTKASVLLVRDEPADGIRERWADTNEQGEFRFDSVPAGRYDYVFAFDNVPGRLRRSLLVGRNVVVKRDATLKLTYRYERISGSDSSAPAVPAAKDAMTFLRDEELSFLADACRRDTALWPGGSAPLLLSDALTGRRVRTTLIREWLLGASARLDALMAKGSLDDAARPLLLDLATAYNANRASGLLTSTEERELRAKMAIGAEWLAQGAGRKKSWDRDQFLTLGAVAAALSPSGLAPKWLKTADRQFEARLKVFAEEAEARPSAIDHAQLCLLLEYAMLRRTMGEDGCLNGPLKRAVELGLACLTPEQRRVAPHSRAAAPPQSLGSLGLAKTAFAEDDLGGELRAAWEMCGSPFWAPRADESVLGAALTAAALPPRRRAGAAGSLRLTDTTALLTHQRGSAAEWMMLVSGWSIEVHAGAAKLATLDTSPTPGNEMTTPHVLSVVSSPACDYVLLGGWAKRDMRPRLAAYRHVLFNKLTGYLVVSDEFPAGFLTHTKLGAPRGVRRNALTGSGGLTAHLLGLAVTPTADRSSITLKTMSGRPTLAISLTPAKLEPWIVSRISLADDDKADTTGRHVVLTTSRGSEYIRLARVPAQVSDNVRDDLIDGSVALIRRGAKSVDLVLLVDGRWAQTDEHRLALENGHGYVTILNTGEAMGWSAGESRDVEVGLGDNARKSPKLTVDGRGRSVKVKNQRAAFELPGGAHSFRLK
jgi:hypothetical protein